MERESGGSHSHTEPSSQKIYSSSGKGYGVAAMVIQSLLCPEKRSSSCGKGKVVVVIVIQSLLLRRYLPLPGKGMGW